MRKTSAVALAVAAVAAGFMTGTAHAETNPSCSSMTQIGRTAYTKVGGETVAPVKHHYAEKSLLDHAD
jgi:hypothetical protein